MIAAISMMQPRADLSIAQFRRHWLDPHGVMTAELPRVKRYVQSHCIDHRATNALAKSLAIAGFPELWFDSIADRTVAYTSTRIAECNVDSESFVGSVCRLVTEPRVVKAAAAGPHESRQKVILLAVGAPDPAWSDTTEARVSKLPGVTDYIAHRLIEQAAAPNSKIPELKIPVAGIAEVTFANEDALMQNRERLLGSDDERIALYVVQDTVFI
jgi:uncharacterized protein (TIGR02118 family)